MTNRTITISNNKGTSTLVNAEVTGTSVTYDNNTKSITGVSEGTSSVKFNLKSSGGSLNYYKTINFNIKHGNKGNKEALINSVKSYLNDYGEIGTYIEYAIINSNTGNCLSTLLDISYGNEFSKKILFGNVAINIDFATDVSTDNLEDDGLYIRPYSVTYNYDESSELLATFSWDDSGTAPIKILILTPFYLSPTGTYLPCAFYPSLSYLKYPEEAIYATNEHRTTFNTSTLRWENTLYTRGQRDFNDDYIGTGYMRLWLYKDGTYDLGFESSWHIHKKIYYIGNNGLMLYSPSIIFSWCFSPNNSGVVEKSPILINTNESTIAYADRVALETDETLKNIFGKYVTCRNTAVSYG